METRKKYTTPQLQLIQLDNEISLALESNPPFGPEEIVRNVQTPFKDAVDLV